MKKIYLKIITDDINPNYIVKKIGLKVDDVMIKGEKIGDDKGKYGYNGFIINLGDDFSDIDYKLDDILEIKNKIDDDKEFSNKIELNLNIIINNYQGLYIENELMNKLSKMGINLDIHD